MTYPRCLFTVLLTACVCPFINGQAGINIHDHLLIRDSNRYLYGSPEEKYEGSPYLNDEFQTAYVYAGKMKFNGVPMRYNIHEDIMEYQERGQTFLLEPDPKITKIEMGNQVFVVLPDAANGFFELRYEGRLSLLSKMVINYRKANYVTAVPAKYSRQDDVFYIIAPDRPARKVTSLKQFLDYVNEKKDELAQYANAENLSFRRGEDILKLVKYHN